MKKRFIFLLFVALVYFLLSNSIILKADEIYGKKNSSISHKEAICEVMEFVASDADSYGLSGINFNNLQITTAIPMYEYKNGTFNQPLLFHLVAVSKKAVEIVQKSEGLLRELPSVSNNLLDKS